MASGQKRPRAAVETGRDRVETIEERLDRDECQSSVRVGVSGGDGGSENRPDLLEPADTGVAMPSTMVSMGSVRNRDRLGLLKQRLPSPPPPSFWTVVVVAEIVMASSATSASSDRDKLARDRRVPNESSLGVGRPEACRRYCSFSARIVDARTASEALMTANSPKGGFAPCAALRSTLIRAWSCRKLVTSEARHVSG